MGSRGFRQALPGTLPVLLYGILYYCKTIVLPADRRWEDFYGFNKGGKWIISLAGMILGTFAVCMALIALQNL